MPSDDPILAIDDAIRCRITTKVLSEAELAVHDHSAVLDDLVGLAGFAPFHRPCDETHRTELMSGIEPWRFHVLDGKNCRLLGQKLPFENAGKIPSMLAAADALIVATWLPNPPSKESASPQAEQLFEPTLGNMEHIAAASAAIQNLLLAATARGIANYWSSGGILRTAESFNLLGINQREILLGAIFLFPSEIGSAQKVGSKLRDRRSLPTAWVRRIAL